MKKNETGNTLQISTREKEVLQHLADGASAAQIADKLFISADTVKNHIKSMHKKMKVKKSIELVKLYMQNYF